MTGKRAWIDVHGHAMNEPYRNALAGIGGVIRTPEWSRAKALEFSERHDTGTGILSLGSLARISATSPRRATSRGWT